MDNRPIGIMDSGVGGLTVAKALAARYPEEGIVFVGDTARNPYGSRTPGEIESFASDMKNFLLSRDVKLILIACNTISFNVSEAFLTAPVPVVKMSLDVTFPADVERVGIFATPATIVTHIHKRALETKFPDLSFLEIPVDGAAAAIEQGKGRPDIAAYIKKAVQDADAADVDTGLWACTHYPLAAEAFREVLPEARFIDPADATVEAGMRLLRQADALADCTGEKQFYFTAGVDRSAALVRSIFGSVPVELAAIAAKP